MPRWEPIAKLEECLPGQGIERVVGERIVALFNVAGEYHALDGICPHQGGPLAQGTLCGAVVTCPWHGWQFDVTTGQHQFAPSVVQPRLNVKVEGDRVWVDLDAECP